MSPPHPSAPWQLEQRLSNVLRPPSRLCAPPVAPAKKDPKTSKIAANLVITG
jgi:hypothetical protein